MAKKQGKVKAIPVTKVTKRMQVIIKNPNIKGHFWSSIVDDVTDPSGLRRFHVKNTGWYELSELKTLIVEYELHVSSNNIDSPIGEWTKKYRVKQLPLKKSQWQSAIDNGEVDSDQIVEFEIRDNAVRTTEQYSPISNFKHQKIAKIIPQRKKLYTQEEVDKIKRNAFSIGYNEAMKLHNDNGLFI